MNTNRFATIAKLSYEALLASLETLAGRAREATAELIAHLSELQIRKAHRGEGPGSLFEYCTRVLRLSEAASFNRIAAASAARKFPLILDLLADGSINLTTVRVLAPYLTSENHQEALRAAIGRTKQEVKEIRARLAPQPDVPPSVRKLPTPRQEPAPRSSAPAVVVPSSREESNAPEPNPPVTVMAQSSPPAQRPVVEPLSPERYRVQFTIGTETKEKLRRIQDLMRREILDGDPGAIFDRALTVLLADVEKKRFSATTRPRPPKAARPQHLAPLPGPQRLRVRDGLRAVRPFGGSRDDGRLWNRLRPGRKPVPGQVRVLRPRPSTSWLRTPSGVAG